MSDPTFMADPTRLVIAAIVGIALLLALIIKFKLHPVLSMMVSALVIGIGLALSFSYILFTTVTSTFAINGYVSPMVAAWIPNILYTFIAIYLYQKAPR